MFPDCELVEKIRLSKAKAAAAIPFGLGLYLKNKNLLKIGNSEYFACCFDECFNKVERKSQMDLVVRIWDEEENKVPNFDKLFRFVI